MRSISDPVLAIDIGGSKLSTGLVAADGTVLKKEIAAWDALDADSVMRTILAAARRMLEPGSGPTPAAVGVNIPGLADPERGIWIEAVFSGIRNVPIGTLLSEALGLPVRIDNDVNNCALAESRFGACRGTADFVWLTVSNGCGGAVFLDGHVYRGAFGSAGEFGHIRVEDEGGYRCGCGNDGCLEAQAAGPGLARRYREAGGARTDGRDATAREIAERARNGERLALEVYGREGYYLGKALAAVLNVLNPAKAVVGGGISAAFDLFEPEMVRTIERMTYREASRRVSVEKTGLGYDAALVGAATLALMRGNP